MSASIRPSSLPKLAVSSGGCACFESSPGSSPAAARGLRMDATYRSMLNGDASPLHTLEPEEQEAVTWAVATTKRLAGDNEIISDEDNLKVIVPGIDHVGTEDARVIAASLSLDLKSGQIRNYKEQMAAYALGNMQAYFVPKWTYVLLFADHKAEIVHEFTFEEAKAIVDEVLSDFNDPDKVATPCDYCCWCAKKNTCAALVRPIAQSLEIVEQSTLTLEDLKHQIVSNPARLGAFLSAANLFKKELWDFAKDHAKGMLERGEEVPGWKISKSKGSEVFDILSIIEAALTTKATMTEVVELLGGEIDGKKFREWTEKRGYTPSATEAKTKPGFSRMLEVKGKKKQLQ